MKDAMQKVEEFHAAFGHPIEITPGLPNPERRRLRVGLGHYSEYITAEGKVVRKSQVFAILL